MEKRFSLPEFGYEVTLGKFAGQADGAAWLQQGGTVVLSAVTSAASTEFPGFFPLTVDYREHFSAAGRIPGGYFKREGKPTDKEVLSGRLIDRAIRPLFPDKYFNQVQVSSTLYSVDDNTSPSVLALLATSIALISSKIPFIEPVGVAEVARINGKFVLNPTYTQSLSSDLKVIVAGTAAGICMVEGAISEINEKELLDVLFMAHDVIKKQVAWQHEIQKDLAVEKEVVATQFDWDAWQGRAAALLTDAEVTRLFTQDKVARESVRSELRELFLNNSNELAQEQGISKTFLSYLFETVLCDRINDLTFALNKRIDNRDFDTVRQISVEVDVLPGCHGSSVFNRGKTQALVTATLGGGQDEQRLEDLRGESKEGSFMLHYNFPSYSVGEVRPNRGPGRREVGHGYLALSALKFILPDKDAFPYTIRLVADILSSDGSTSMATVCGGTMALMQAGVPIKNMVSGAAMGLLQGPDGQFRVLTDIAGIEDAFGLMDFKVAGTEKGITAIQMDIKYKGGLPREVFEMALEKARKARAHIMSEMRKVMSEPNKALSPLVPRIVSLKVPTDKIGAIIGKGGLVIREIIERTGTQIDIEDDGTVKILGQPGEKLDQAVTLVKTLSGSLERGMRFVGKITRIAEFGLFVEVAPGKDGLVHISMIPRAEQDTFMRSVKTGDIMHVEVLEYDPISDKIRLKPIRD